MARNNDDNSQDNEASAGITQSAEPEGQDAKPQMLSRVKAQFTKTNAIFLILVIIAVVLAVQYRTSMLNFYGFYEPDGFYYFTAMRAIVNNGFQFPSVLSISGWPIHHMIAENHGLYYATLIPYLLLGESVSYYTIMRLVPVLFGLLDMLAAYMLSRYISKDKIFGFFVLLFVGLSMGNAARTSALVYRGDSFVLFFAMAALIFFVEVLRQDDPKKKIIMSAAAAVSMLLANYVWSGGTVAMIMFVLAYFIIVSYAFIFRKEKLVDGGKYLLLSLLIWFVLVNAAKATGAIGAVTFSDISFIPMFMSLALFWLLAYYAPSIAMDFMRTPLYRFFILLFVIVVGTLIFAMLEPAIIYGLFVGNGFVIPPGGFGSTTEELQPPSCQFLYTSFGVNLFTAIPNLFIALTSVLNTNLQCTSSPIDPVNGIWAASYGAYGVILLLLLFIPYFFMQVYDSHGLLGGKPRLKFDATPGMMVLMALFIITAYLEMHVIRYNSLLSVPLSMMSAFTIYWLMLVANNTKLAYPYVRFLLLVALGAVFIYVFYQLVYYANMYSATLTQADSINPQFISAMQYDGRRNLADGENALQDNVSGACTTAVGVASGSGNITGTFNTFVGFDAGASADPLTNSTAIGAYSTVGENDALILGGTTNHAVSVGIGTATPYIDYALDVETVNSNGTINGGVVVNANGGNLPRHDQHDAQIPRGYQRCHLRRRRIPGQRRGLRRVDGRTRPTFRIRTR